MQNEDKNIQERKEMIERIEEVMKIAMKLSDDLTIKPGQGPKVKKIKAPKRRYRYTVLKEDEESTHFHCLQEVADYLEINYARASHLFHYTATNGYKHRDSNDKLRGVRIVKYVEKKE